MSILVGIFSTKHKNQTRGNPFYYITCTRDYSCLPKYFGAFECETASSRLFVILFYHKYIFSWHINQGTINERKSNECFNNLLPLLPFISITL
uniref:Uncharacterized protein n=1 Tax=Setaria italica TaxID=4555 RepID=K3YDQ1_SETIT